DQAPVLNSRRPTTTLAPASTATATARTRPLQAAATARGWPCGSGNAGVKLETPEVVMAYRRTAPLSWPTAATAWLPAWTSVPQSAGLLSSASAAPGQRRARAPGQPARMAGPLARAAHPRAVTPVRSNNSGPPELTSRRAVADRGWEV